MALEGSPKQISPDSGLSPTSSRSEYDSESSFRSKSEVSIEPIDPVSEHLSAHSEAEHSHETEDPSEDREPPMPINEGEKIIDATSARIENQEPLRSPTEENSTPELTANSSLEEKTRRKQEEKQLPKNYSIQTLDLLLPLSSDESICSLAAYQSNLYVGTTHSKIFHLYLFEDAEDYIVISQSSISNDTKGKVNKILLLSDVELCLISCNKVIYTYLLPELSPCSVGKIRDVHDILTLSQVKSAKVKSKLDKIVAFTSTKIRLLQFSKDTIKLLKDIPYTGSVIGLSSAAGTLSNYSNICFVANNKNYDVVDIQLTRRIPLSEFNPSKINYNDKTHDIRPFIVPFTAEDKPEKPEEYLLSICSDSTSSMALFVNSEGDVIRGTLIWDEVGYPTRGLTIEWPYVIGLFWNGQNKTERLCICSLETLEIVFVSEVSAVLNETLFKVNDLLVQKVEPAFSVLDRELLYALQLVSFLAEKPAQSSKQYKNASIAFIGGSSLAFLDLKSSLSSELQNILLELQNDSSKRDVNIYCEKLKQFSNENDKIWPLYIASLLLAGQWEEVKLLFKNQDQKKRVDPRLLLLWCNGIVDDSEEFWKEFYVPRFVLNLHVVRTKDADLKFRTWVIEETYRRREYYGEEINSQIRKYNYTMCGKSTSALIELAELEKDLWIAQNKTSDDLLSYFDENHNYLLLICLYSMKQREGNHFKEWHHLIIDLALDVLSGRKALNDSDELYKLENQLNLVEVVFYQLHDRVDDEKYFAKNLLELLKLLPDQGLALLKKHKGGKFLSCNKMILSELSKSVKLDHKFSSLKLEYSEQAFINSLTSETNFVAQAQDFVVEILNYMNEENFEEEYENLNILFQTYQVENSLSDPSWPKLTWIEFLHLHGNNSECKELARVYVKLYELLLLIIGTDSEVPIEFKQERPVSQYLIHMTKSDSQIEYLLELGDYSTAEWTALCGVYPIPREGAYLEFSLAKLREIKHAPKELILKNIHKVLNFYLKTNDEKAKSAAMNHVFADIVGDIVPVAEILQLVPDNFPIWCVRNFATKRLISMSQVQSEYAIRKVLARQDAKFSKLLLLDFQSCHADLLQ